MSVGFYSCDCCGESVCEDYVDVCSKCGHSLCTECLINDDIHAEYAYEYNVKFDGSDEQKEMYGIKSKEEAKEYECGYEIGDIIYNVGIDSKYCPYCSGNEIHNDDLLEFALKLLNTSKNDLIKKYVENKYK